jgi:HAD superfamily hydrolase (TIGR01549 family)
MRLSRCFLIIDLDQTLVDSRIALDARGRRDWDKVYALISRFDLYDGVNTIFSKCAQYKIEIAIVTSGPRSYLERVLKFFNWTPEVTVAYHDTKLHKPHPEPLFEAMKRLGVERNDLVIVAGDSVDDIVAAEKVADNPDLAKWVAIVGCLWGANSAETLKEHEGGYNYYTCESPTDLVELVFDECDRWGREADDDSLVFLGSYYPMRLGADVIGDKEAAWRDLILDFKDGNRVDEVAAAVSDYLIENYNEGDLSNLYIVPIPASSTGRHETRFRAFCDYVSKKTGIQDGYELFRRTGVSVSARHRGGPTKNLSELLEVEAKVDAKEVIIFDDTFTSGSSYMAMKDFCELHGAVVRGGLFLGKTRISPVKMS